MPATYSGIFDRLWPWFVKWGANGKLLVAARLFSAYLGTGDDDDDEEDCNGVDIETTIAGLSAITGNDGFSPLKADHQHAYVELLTALGRAGFDFDPNHNVSLQQNKDNNPGINGFFVGELKALCSDLRTFGPLQTFLPAKTIKNVMRIMKVTKEGG